MHAYSLHICGIICVPDAILYMQISVSFRDTQMFWNMITFFWLHSKLWMNLWSLFPCHTHGRAHFTFTPFASFISILVSDFFIKKLKGNTRERKNLHGLYFISCLLCSSYSKIKKWRQKYMAENPIIGLNMQTFLQKGFSHWLLSLNDIILL